MKDVIKKIKELEKELKSVEKRMKQVRTCKEYDFLEDEMYSIVFDIRLEAEKLTKYCTWHIEDTDKKHLDSIGTGRRVYGLLEMAEIRASRNR